MIITISREFGSGGRELGKRLAEALHIPCYDHQIIEMIAKENGLNADYVANVGEKCIEAAYPMTIGHRLAMMPVTVMDQPIRVAVAQRQDAKVERCMKRAPEGEHLTRAEMEKAIRRIDKERAQNHLMYADTKWGTKEAYHLCVNTTHREIKQLVPALAQFCKDWFAAE